LNEELFAAVLRELRLLRSEITELKAIVAPEQAETVVNFYKESNGMDSKISALFLELKLPVHVKGHGFLKEAIKRVYNDFNLFGCFTTILYPEIATKFNTAPNRVERGIRHAIEISWSKNRSHPIYRNHVKTKPTNSEFIALIADKFRMEDQSKMEVI
jgi:two-component system, response regulator, stage 0 sporulation protein A